MSPTPSDPGARRTRRWSRLVLPGLVGAALLLTTGVVARGLVGGEDPAPVELTSRAVAAVAAEHVDPKPRTAEESTLGGVGAQLVYPDSSSVEVLVRSPLRGSRYAGVYPVVTEDCEQVRWGCEVHEADGGPVMLAWTEADPGEDPGGVRVCQLREDADVCVLYVGDSITDPREQDLSIPLDVLESIARDDRLALLTTFATDRSFGDLVR